MLSAVGTNSVIQATQGQYLTIERQFTSDADLSGELIRFTPFFYLENTENPIPNSYLFSRSYSTGTMTAQNAANANVSAELEVINTFNFIIRYSFFVWYDTKGYLSDTGYVNSTLLNIFDPIEKNIGLYVSASQETTLYRQPVKISPFVASDALWTFQSSGTNIEGYEVGQNLTVKFNNSRSGLNFSNNYYIGVARVDQITNNGLFIDDMSMQFALIDNVPNQVDSLPYSCYVSGTGFNNRKCEAVINGTCLLENAKYQIFIVAKTTGNWISYLSPILSEAIPQNPLNIGTESGQITDIFGNSHATYCATGISACAPITIDYDIDIASHDAALLALGIPDTLKDTFVSLQAYITETIPDQVDENTVIGDTLQTDVSISSSTLSANVSVPAFGSFGGTKYVVFKAVFDLTTYTDTHYRVFKLSYDAPKEVLSYTLTDPSAATTDVICAEDTGNYTAAFTGVGTYSAYVSINGGNCVTNSDLITENPTNVQIDVDELPLEGQVCIYLLEEGTSTAEPCQDCEILDVFIRQRVTDNPSLMAIDIVTSDDVDMDILVVNQVKSSVNYTYSALSTSQFTTNQAITPGANSWGYFITFTNGSCTYRVAGQVLNIVSNSDPISDHVNLKLEATQTPCNPTETETDCEANNKSNLVWSCTPATQTISLTWNDTFTDTIDTDVSSCISNGVVTSPCPASIIGEEEVFVSRTITFTNGCVIHVSQDIVCKDDSTLNCQNSQSVTVSYVDKSFTVTTVDSFTSTPTNTAITYSVDNGVTFLPYTGETTTEGQQIIVRSYVEFDDGCPDLEKIVTANNSSSTQLAYQKFRQVFTEPTGDSVTITKNDGNVTDNHNHVFVFLNGVLLSNSNEIQYSKVGPVFTFTKNASSYDLTGKTVDIHFWAEVDASTIGLPLRQLFTPTISTTSVTVTVGTVPDDMTNYWVYIGGQNILDIIGITFTKVGNVFSFFEDDMVTPYDVINRNVEIVFHENI